MSEKFLIICRDITAGVLGLVSILCGIYLSLQEKVSSATVCFGGGILLLIFSSIKSFESFKGFGIEAKTRKLDDKIKEADDLLQHIKILAESLAEVTFITLNNDRFDSTIRNSHKYEIAKKIRLQLEKLGTSSDQINVYMEPWHKTVVIDLLMQVFKSLIGTNEKIHNHYQHLVQMSAQGTDNYDEIRHNSLLNKLTASVHFSENLHKLWNSRYFELSPNNLISQRDCLPNISEEEKVQLKIDTDLYLNEATYFIHHKEFNNIKLWLDLESNQ